MVADPTYLMPYPNPQSDWEVQQNLDFLNQWYLAQTSLPSPAPQPTPPTTLGAPLQGWEGAGLADTNLQPPPQPPSPPPAGPEVAPPLMEPPPPPEMPPAPPPVGSVPPPAPPTAPESPPTLTTPPVQSSTVGLLQELGSGNVRSLPTVEAVVGAARHLVAGTSGLTNPAVAATLLTSIIDQGLLALPTRGLRMEQRLALDEVRAQLQKLALSPPTTSTSPSAQNLRAQFDNAMQNVIAELRGRGQLGAAQELEGRREALFSQYLGALGQLGPAAYLTVGNSTFPLLSPVQFLRDISQVAALPVVPLSMGRVSAPRRNLSGPAPEPRGGTRGSSAPRRV